MAEKEGNDFKKEYEKKKKQFDECDYCAVLELGPNATRKEMSKAYYELIKRYHHDLNLGNFEAEEIMKMLNYIKDIVDEKTPLHEGKYKEIPKSQSRKTKKHEPKSTFLEENEYYERQKGMLDEYGLLKEKKEQLLLKEEEKHKLLKGRKEPLLLKESWGERFQSKISTPTKKFKFSLGGSPIRKVIWLIILCVIGMVMSSVLGNYWAFFAFFFWAFYMMVPENKNEIMKVTEKIAKQYARKILEIKEDIKSLIKQLGKTHTKSKRDEIRATIKSYENDIRRGERLRDMMIKSEISSMRKEEYKFKKSPNLYIKNALQLGAFISIVVSLLTSGIPLAQPVGLLVGFFLYMGMGGFRDLKD